MSLNNTKQVDQTGILLVNLGSPENYSVSAVRRYLKEFLWDPRVVNIPRVIWWLLLNFIVLPFRPSKSAKAYAKIWIKEGSPLVVNSQHLSDKLGENFTGPVKVELAMRYGEPKISQKLEKFKQEGINKLVVLPLYPQYSMTTTASVFDAVTEEIENWPYIPSFNFINDYYQNPKYITAIANSIQQYRELHGQSEKLLISFHGLPEKSIELGDPYHDQCQKTASLIAAQLGLPKKEWQIVFQSRFGRAQWLQPYCLEVLRQLPKQGITKIDLVCPGFSADCLETLEEIAMTNKSEFINAGGQQYHYIPALNASQENVDLLADLIKINMG